MKKTCDIVAEQLKQYSFRVCTIHGNKSQSAREIVLSNFRSGKVQILIATNVASRGIGNDI
jgi:superfamily II DNA/RNA helicase